MLLSCEMPHHGKFYLKTLNVVFFSDAHPISSVLHVGADAILTQVLTLE